MIGGSKFNIVEDERRRAHFWSNVWPLDKFENCLGYDLRDEGHKRVPEPPAKITG